MSFASAIIDAETSRRPLTPFMVSIKQPTIVVAANSKKEVRTVNGYRSATPSIFGDLQCPISLDDFDEPIDVVVERERGTPIIATVLGYIIAPGLAIVQVVTYSQGGNVAISPVWYTLTHLPSGRIVMPRSFKLPVAYTVAEYMKNKADWMLSYEDLHAYNRATDKSVGKAVQRCREWLKNGLLGKL